VDLNYEISMTPRKGGQPVKITNVITFAWNPNRPPNVNGHLGMRRHRLNFPTLKRWVSLPVAGQSSLESEIMAAAAATELKAYYDIEVKLAPAEDPTNFIRTIRLDNAHVCEISETIGNGQIVQSLTFSPTRIEVDGVVFEQSLDA
jgi:hypothetical protein